MSVLARATVSLLAGAILSACSVKHVAVNALGNALAEGGSNYARDDDPDLVWEAVPLGLDEGYDHGVLHDFFISWEGRGEAVGGSFERARAHLERAQALSGGARVSALVNFAETVSVARQDRKEFTRLLGQALAVDAGA